MTEQPKHTPLPWEVGQYGWDINTQTDDAVGQSYTGEPQWRENAEFIVRAVNNHYALLAACRAAADVFGRLHEAALVDEPELAGNISRLADLLREAVANAEGGGA